MRTRGWTARLGGQRGEGRTEERRTRRLEGGTESRRSRQRVSSNGGNSTCRGSGARSCRCERTGTQHSETVPSIIRSFLSLSIRPYARRVTICSQMARTCLSRAPGVVCLLGTTVWRKQWLPFVTHALAHIFQKSWAEKATENQKNAASSAWTLIN